MTNSLQSRHGSSTRPINASTHAVLDYATATTLLMMGARWRHSHPRAANLAFLNGASVLLLSLLTDYPGGMFRAVSFKTHGTIDALQAGMMAMGPALMGFTRDQEAMMFYGQAAFEAVVVACTDFASTR